MNDFLNDTLPPEVFFFAFTGIAAVAVVFALHALVIAWTQPKSRERFLSLAIAGMMFFTVAWTFVFFALAFLITAAVLSGIGLVIFAPPMIATVVCLIAWVRARSYRGN